MLYNYYTVYIHIHTVTIANLGKELCDEKVGQLGSDSGLRNVSENERACDRNLPSSKPLLSFSAH